MLQNASQKGVYSLNVTSNGYVRAKAGKASDTGTVTLIDFIQSGDYQKTIPVGNTVTLSSSVDFPANFTNKSSILNKITFEWVVPPECQIVSQSFNNGIANATIQFVSSNPTRNVNVVLVAKYNDGLLGPSVRFTTLAGEK